MKKIVVQPSSDLEGSAADETIESGTTSGDFLTTHEVTDMSHLLEPDDIVSFTPRNVEASAPTCELRKLRRHLRHLGWVQEDGTVGDHENWRSPGNLLLQLNPDKQDSKVADLASHKKCAAILGISSHTLYETVARHS